MPERTPSRTPAYRYRWGVLLDMVGATDLQITRRITASLGGHAAAGGADLGDRPPAGRPRVHPADRYVVHDDHVPLHDMAKIPTCDLIDFDYPPWHTEGDTPDKCSALSLAKVGWVLGEWLKTPAPKRE